MRRVASVWAVFCALGVECLLLRRPCDRLEGLSRPSGSRSSIRFTRTIWMCGKVALIAWVGSIIELCCARALIGDTAVTLPTTNMNAEQTSIAASEARAVLIQIVALYRWRPSIRAKA